MSGAALFVVLCSCGVCQAPSTSCSYLSAPAWTCQGEAKPPLTGPSVSMCNCSASAAAGLSGLGWLKAHAAHAPTTNCTHARLAGLMTLRVLSCGPPSCPCWASGLATALTMCASWTTHQAQHINHSRCALASNCSFGMVPLDPAQLQYFGCTLLGL